MRPYHISLALLVAIIWGVNFIFIKFALIDLPPFLLSALRFFVVSIPAVFFIKKPAIAWRMITLYALFMFVMQFTLLFAGMKAGMPPGLTSIVAQTQVIFSLFFAIVFLGERPRGIQLLGAALSCFGIVLVCSKVSETGADGSSLYGFLCILAAAICVGVGNMLTKKIGPVNSLALVAWGALIATPPLLFMSYFIEGSATIIYSVQHASWLTIVSVLYIAYVSTWLGYGLWNWLIGQYMINSVVPVILLVPIVAIFSSIIVFNESLQPWKMVAAGLVILGLSINLLGPYLHAQYQQRRLGSVDI